MLEGLSSPAVRAAVLWVLALAALSGCAVETAPHPPDENLPVQFESLAPGVWMHIAHEYVRPWGPVRSNGLVVAVGQDEALLIDTAWTDEQTAEVLAWVDEALGRTVTAAVLTHAHRDKMGGVRTLREAGIATYANARSNELAPSRGLEPAEHGLDFDANGLPTDRPIGALPGLRLFYPGAAHTEDNIVVYIDDAAILFGGCLVRPGGATSLGNTADGDIGHWSIAAERIDHHFPEARVVVPSHGPPGDRGLLRHTAVLARSAEPGTPD